MQKPNIGSAIRNPQPWQVCDVSPDPFAETGSRDESAHVRRKIEKGLEDCQAGRVYTTEQVKQHFARKP